MKIDWKKTDTTKPPVNFIKAPQSATVQVGNSYTVTWSFGMDIFKYDVLLYEVINNKRYDLSTYKSPGGLIPAGQELTYIVPAQSSAKELRVIIHGDSYERMSEYICGFWESVPRYEPGAMIKITWQTGEVKSTVSFNANGGSGTMLTVNDVKGTYELPECTFGAPDGKQFAGWAYSATGAILSNTIEVNQNTTLYAIWEDSAVTPEDPEIPEDPEPEQPGEQQTEAPAEKKGLSTGAVVAIVVVSVLVVGTSGFALVWFVIKKKTWADFANLFKKK